MTKLRKYAHLLGKRGRFTNCWGTTLWVLGVHQEHHAIFEDRMEPWLATNTVPVDADGIRPGDILVWRWYESLIHTAVCIGDGRYFHQDSYGGRFYVETYEDITSQWYTYCDQLSHVRCRSVR